MVDRHFAKVPVNMRCTDIYHFSVENMTWTVEIRRKQKHPLMAILQSHNRRKMKLFMQNQVVQPLL